MTVINTLASSIKEAILPPEDAVIRQIEWAARTCYKSETKGRKEAIELLIKLMEREHWSPFEFSGLIAIKLICSRSCSHQLVRHRMFSYAQESQRYVKPTCPAFIEPEGFTGWPEELQKQFVDHIMEDYRFYNLMLREGLKPQQARSVLPNCTPTIIIGGGNLRMWFEFLQKRFYAPGIDNEMLQIAEQILMFLDEQYPEIMKPWRKLQGEEGL